MNAFTSWFLIFIADVAIAFVMTIVGGGDDRDFKLNFIGILLASILYEVMK